MRRNDIVALALLQLKLVLVTSTILGRALGGGTSKLQIHIPQSLSKPGSGYDHRDALFGIPPYGGSIEQQLYYTPSTLCQPTTDLSDCFPQSNKRGKKSDNQPPTSPFILMVDRGDCTFVMKVRHAQRAGASAVLIADNVCQCSATNCTNDNDYDECESTEPLMADDGSGADISIPAFLIFKQDADPIKNALKKNQQVRAEMSFSIPAPNARVNYDLWTTPKDKMSTSFLASWRAAAVALDKHAFFSPHMYIYDGRRAGCQGFKGENMCYTLCTNNGMYCASDPDSDLDRGISGADVVTESLRRLCIWDKYGQDGVGAPWWDYIASFTNMCDTTGDDDATISKAGKFTDQNCIARAMSAAKVDKSIVDKCMKDSGGLEGNATNTILEEELSHREVSGVVVIPTLFVNQAPLRGALSFSTVLKGICAGYAPGSEPDVCKECASCQDEQSCVQVGHCTFKDSMSPSSVTLSTFAITLLVSVLLFTCIGLIVHRRQQAHMREQVRGILAEYMPIDEQNRRGKNMDTSVGIEEDDDVNGGELHFTIT